MKALVVAAACLVAASTAAAPVAILCADDGTYSGTSEIKFIEAEVADRAPLALPYCQSSYSGTYRGHPVVLATTGIGSEAAALCTSAVLRHGPYSHVVFVGTSGWSPNQGGWNPAAGRCGKIDAAPVAIGSVCVTATAVNVNCRKRITNADAAPTECRVPASRDALQESLFGRCVSQQSNSFAQELAALGRATALPSVNTSAVVLNGTKAWWAATENQAASQRVPLAPAVIGPDQCAEAVTRDIWAGPAMDYECRETVHGVLNAGKPMPAAAKTVCASAMESLGAQAALNGIPAAQRPKFATVRGASNYDYHPVKHVSGRWVQAQTEDPAFVVAGYHFAIRTSNAVVLAFLRTLV